MKTTLLIPTMISLVLASSAFAKNLDDYRKDLNLTAKNVEIANAASVKSGSDILTKLSAQIALDDFLIGSKDIKAMETPARISFGNSVKRFLDLNSSVLKRDQEMERPVTVNPKWSPEFSRQVKNERRNFVCRYVLKNFNVNELLVNLLDEASVRKDGLASFAVSSLQDKKLALLNDALAAVTEGAKRGSAIDVLGKAVHFDVHNGVISEIHLSTAKGKFTDANTVSMTLPMLVNARTQKDDYFVQSVNCLQEYLKEQSDTLEIRQSELSGGSASVKIKKTEMNLANLYKAYLENINGGVELTKDAFYRIHLIELSDEDAAASYLLKRDQYLLGQNLPVAKELALNKRRIADLSMILPYLKNKVAGANRTNKLLKALTTQQLDQLISVMVQLRGRDIPTRFDIDKMIDLAVMKNDKAMTAEVLEYQILLQALTALQMNLSEPAVILM